MSTTKELRRLLEERGVEYETTNEDVTTVYLDDSVISYFHQKGKFSAEINIPRPRLNATEWLSPEQVIEITLGRRTCKLHDCEGSFAAVNKPVWRCDCGAFVTQYTDATTYHKPRYCPNCGRKVVE